MSAGVVRRCCVCSKYIGNQTNEGKKGLSESPLMNTVFSTVLHFPFLPTFQRLLRSHVRPGRLANPTLCCFMKVTAHIYYSPFTQNGVSNMFPYWNCQNTLNYQKYVDTCSSNIFQNHGQPPLFWEGFPLEVGTLLQGLLPFSHKSISEVGH